MAKFAGVVQARMGSTRLPGKVIAEVRGRPLIWHIADRLTHAARLDSVMIATSAGSDCDPVRAVAARYRLACFSGSEADLLQRLSGACRAAGADAFVRVTADSPFVDPEVVDSLIELYESRAPDVDCAVNYLPRRYPYGLDLEVFPLAFVDRLSAEIQEPHDREWFPSYVTTRPERFRIAALTNPEDRSAVRCTVDYPEDLEFCRAVYHRLWIEGGVFGMKDMLALLEREPALGAINAMHAR